MQGLEPNFTLVEFFSLRQLPRKIHAKCLANIAIANFSAVAILAVSQIFEPRTNYQFLEAEKKAPWFLSDCVIIKLALAKRVAFIKGTLK